MDEAGQNTEPPTDDSDGASAAPALSVPPLPADEVSRPGSGSPYAMGYRSGLASSADDVTDPAKGGGTVVTDSAAGDYVGSARVGSAGVGSVGAGAAAGTGELLSGAASALGDRLDGGRQAMRQAAAATSSWFANRAGTQTATRSPAEASTHPETRPEPVPVMDSAPASSPTVPSPPSSPWSFSAAATEPAGAGVGAAGVGAAAANYGGDASAGYGGGAPGYGGSAPGYGASAGQPAARSAGYSSAATPGWHSRVTAAERRPEPPRRGRRQAHLTLSRVEPWSVMKFSFVASVVAFIILFVAVAVLYMALAGLGVFSSLQHTVSTITSSQNTVGTNISDWFSASRILGYTGMLGALNIVLITALSTIGSVLYNLIAQVFGGIEVTLRETD